MNPFLPAKTEFGPIGTCIYCGATTYTPDGGYLHDEHIIAEGLGGAWVLPAASCRACEVATAYWENKLLRGFLQSFRRHLGLPSKKPKKRDKELPLFVNPHNTGHLAFGPGNERVMVAVEDYPVFVTLVGLPAPRIVAPNRPDEAKLWLHLVHVDGDLLRDKYGLVKYSLPVIDQVAQHKVLAKIAHCHAVSQLGLDRFEPFLVPYLLDRSDELNQDLVGGYAPQEFPARQYLHELGFEAMPGIDPQLVVVSIRLFSQFGAPVFLVVAGRLRDDG